MDKCVAGGILKVARNRCYDEWLRPNTNASLFFDHLLDSKVWGSSRVSGLMQHLFTGGKLSDELLGLACSFRGYGIANDMLRFPFLNHRKVNNPDPRASMRLGSKTEALEISLGCIEADSPL